ncbi:hypothetical protein ACJJTC_004941 [Scirpophaga incertulas]
MSLRSPAQAVGASRELGPLAASTAQHYTHTAARRGRSRAHESRSMACSCSRIGGYTWSRDAHPLTSRSRSRRGVPLVFIFGRGRGPSAACRPSPWRRAPDAAERGRRSPSKPDHHQLNRSLDFGKQWTGSSNLVLAPLEFITRLIVCLRCAHRTD